MSITIYYSVMLALAVVNLILFVVSRAHRNNFYFGVLLIVAAVSNGGYLFMHAATSYGEALMATKVAYLGGCFLPSILLLCVLELCDINAGWFGRGMITVTSTFVYSFVLTGGYKPIFFRDIVLNRPDGGAGVTIVEGPYFFLLRLQIYLMLILVIGCCVYAFRENKTASYKNMSFLLVASVFSATSYLVGNIMLQNISVVPVIFVMDGTIILVLQHRVALYDVSSTVAESIVQQDSYGYMLLDKKRNYLGSDQVAQKFFPQVAPLHVDFPLPMDDALFIRIRTLADKLDDTLNTAVDYMEGQGREYEISVDYMLNEKGHQLGYFVEISDATEKRAEEKRLNDYNEKLRADVERETRHLREVQDQMLLGMANMIENRDNSTGGHIKRTSMGVKILVKELMVRDEWEGQFPAKYCEAMIKAAPLHDVGKIAVDDDILKKPGRFTPGEFEQMKMHAPKGAELLHSVIAGIEDPYFVQIAENMAHYHHERWNGNGYPDKLAGDQIPMEARIMAVADVYDALVSKRCYKDSMNYEDAAAIIREGMGTQFDPALADVFEACRPRLEKYYDSQIKAAEIAS